MGANLKIFDNKSSVVFWPDVSLKIGMGHLMESIALAKCLIEYGREVIFFILHYEPAISILKDRGISYETFDEEVKLINKLGKFRKQFSFLVTHHWINRFEAISSLRQSGFKIILFDQLGNKKVSCDILVNSSIVPEWRMYNFRKPLPIQAFGPNYAILRDEIVLAGKARIMREPNRIMVSLGGGDPTGATLRVYKALEPILDDIKLDLILGPSFPHAEKLMKLVGCNKHSNITILQSVKDMGRRLKKSSILISSGGNTLYEAAHLGCPVIVLWEYPHEKIQGKAFERAGIAKCIGNGKRTPFTRIRDEVIRLIEDKDMKMIMSFCGEKFVDGKGSERLVQLISSN